ncbi:hypothetical protein, partial [Ileibacterium valens]
EQRNLQMADEFPGSVSEDFPTVFHENYRIPGLFFRKDGFDLTLTLFVYIRSSSTGAKLIKTNQIIRDWHDVKIQCEYEKNAN